MSEYEFTYFGCRGRGHHTRYLLKDQGIACEEVIVDFKDWPVLKPKMEFGQLPCLKDGDFQLVQSNAILRHLGRTHGLYGSNNREAAMIDMLNDGVEDERMKYTNMIYKNYEAGKEPYINNDMKNFLMNFEKLVSSNNGGKGFAVGNQTSFVDYNLFDMLDNLTVLSPGCLDDYPVLKAYHERMINRPGVKAYRDTDEHKNMAINGNGKQ
ncbi:glutathione S-transferase P-like [Lineus longissimus]|uniref:glutathione S-transferase P-like n=1 Tax=Lineus longissimus TaxID=88925 RepID=UPI002B4D35FE